MYRHVVSFGGGPVGVSHIREVVRESGLAVTEELARSFAVLPPRKALRASSLRLPNPFIIELAEKTRTEAVTHSFTPAETVECDDLNEFVQKGAELWAKLVSRLGAVSRISLHLAEKRQPVEDITPSGIILTPQGAAELRFVGFYAMEDEITAMEQMIREVPLGQDDQPTFGTYL